MPDPYWFVGWAGICPVNSKYVKLRRQVEKVLGHGWRNHF